MDAAGLRTLQFQLDQVNSKLDADPSNTGLKAMAVKLESLIKLSQEEPEDMILPPQAALKKPSERPKPKESANKDADLAFEAYSESRGPVSKPSTLKPVPELTSGILKAPSTAAPNTQKVESLSSSSGPVRRKHTRAEHTQKKEAEHAVKQQGWQSFQQKIGGKPPLGSRIPGSSTAASSSTGKSYPGLDIAMISWCWLAVACAHIQPVLTGATFEVRGILEQISGNSNYVPWYRRMILADDVKLDEQVGRLDFQKSQKLFHTIYRTLKFNPRACLHSSIGENSAWRYLKHINLVREIPHVMLLEWSDLLLELFQQEQSKLKAAMRIIDRLSLGKKNIKEKSGCLNSSSDRDLSSSSRDVSSSSRDVSSSSDRTVPSSDSQSNEECLTKLPTETASAVDLDYGVNESISQYYQERLLEAEKRIASLKAEIKEQSRIVQVSLIMVNQAHSEAADLYRKLDRQQRTIQELEGEAKNLAEQKASPQQNSDEEIKRVAEEEPLLGSAPDGENENLLESLDKFTQLLALKQKENDELQAVVKELRARSQKQKPVVHYIHSSSTLSSREKTPKHKTPEPSKKSALLTSPHTYTEADILRAILAERAKIPERCRVIGTANLAMLGSSLTLFAAGSGLIGYWYYMLRPLLALI